MDSVHLHLIITHVPVFAILTGIIILLYAMISGKKYLDPVAMILFIVSGLAAVIAFQTGEPAEHAVEGLAGVSHSVIESHEEIAEWAMITCGIFGLLAIAAWALRNYWSNYRNALMIGMLILSLVPGILVSITANRGGKIRHTEIRSSVENSANIDSEDSERSEEYEED